MKILIIKTSALGDIVHIFPAVRLLKETLPEARIDWVVEKSNAPLVAANPYVDRVLTISSKQWRKKLFSPSTWKEMGSSLKSLRETTYDVLFDFQANTRSGVITGLAKAKTKVGFGRSYVSEIPNLWFTNLHADPIPGQNIRYDYLSLVEAWTGLKAPPLLRTLLKISPEEQAKLNAFPLHDGRNILVAPGSLWPNKQLHEIQLEFLLNHIDAHAPCKFWLLYGSDKEKALTESLQPKLRDASILGGLSIPFLQHLMQKMDLFIGMDSFPLHLAVEASVPTHSIFGASLASKFGPINLGPLHTTLQGTCPYGKTFPKRCPILRTCPTGACIRGISPELLFDSVKSNTCVKIVDAGEFGETSVLNQVRTGM